MATIKITRDNKLHCNEFIEGENVDTVKFQKNGTITGESIEETDGNVKIFRTGKVQATELIEED